MATHSLLASGGRSRTSGSTSNLSRSLAMTPQDADRMVEASQALQRSLMNVPIPTDATAASKNAAPDDKKGGATPVTTSFLDSKEALHKLLDRKGGTLKLHAMLLEAAKHCKNPVVETFLPRMKASGATDAEANAGIVLFHEMDKSSKLKLVFEVLATSLENNNKNEGETHSADGSNKQEEQNQQHEHDHKENARPNSTDALDAETYSTPSKTNSDEKIFSLNYHGAESLFRTILMAISCCVHSKDDDHFSLKPVVTQDEEISLKESFEPPPDVPKKTEALKESPKSSIHGIPDHLKKEVEHEAKMAAQNLAEYASSNSLASNNNPSKASTPSGSPPEVEISFDMFGAWYNSGGCAVAPWVELLRLSKWKISSAAIVPSSTSAASVPSKKPPLQPKPDMRGRRDDRASHRGHSSQNRTVVTFDFSSATEGAVATARHPLCITLSDENLWVLRALVYRSGLIYRSAADVCKTIMRMSHKRVWDGRPLVTLRRDDFRHLIHSLITPPAPGSGSKTPQNKLSSTDMENFGRILEDYFACFEGNFHQSCTPYHPLSHDEVNAKELAVGFCFLCAGNKSTKLATGFELLDDVRSGFLTQQQLMRFLRSYLTMMVGTSLIKEQHARKRQPLSHGRKEQLRAAVENGAHWTLKHFLKTAREKHPKCYERDAFSFEIFAEWYSQGGYAVAPWLELLDLNKLVSLLGESDSFAAMPQSARKTQASSSASSIRECRSSHRRQHHNRSSDPPAQVLFTFPLANQRSLIVLREDAVYVRGVVEQLGVLSLTSDAIWSTLMTEVKRRPGLRGPHSKPRSKKSADPDKNTLLDLASFLDIMEIVLQSASGMSRKRSAEGIFKMPPSIQELLSNFYHSYDLKQTNAVAMNELMGGLSLLCGGKKSTKLAFSFSVFDGRPLPKSRKAKNKQSQNQSLDSDDLYLFLRSFLIVLFSCCCQTLDMSDSSVDRYIADTAKMVTEDVMRYQWHTRKVERIDFDEFGEWYNEGGFEIAPWLELLDLKKWVLIDDFDALDTQAPSTMPSGATSRSAAAPPTPRQELSLQSPTCPPPPPEDVLDPSFFESDADDIMQMDSMDEMDIMLMPSHDREGDLLPVSKFTYSPRPVGPAQAPNAGNEVQSQALKFHLVSEDDQGGYMLSISQKRIRSFRQIIVDTGLHEVPPEVACVNILNHATAGRKDTDERTITLVDFEAAVRTTLGIKDQASETQSKLLDVLCYIFNAFDAEGKGKPNALKVACGFTVLCRGKKSDKLEYSFEVLDVAKRGELSKDEMRSYMQSFLTVLLGIAFSPSLQTDETDDYLRNAGNSEDLERTTESLVRASAAGATWASNQVFLGQQDLESVTFDSLASWYTSTGHQLVPWIELLDLRKWLI